MEQQQIIDHLNSISARQVTEDQALSIKEATTIIASGNNLENWLRAVEILVPILLAICHKG